MENFISMLNDSVRAVPFTDAVRLLLCCTNIAHKILE